MVVALMLINFADKAVLGLAADPIMEEFGLTAGEYGAIASSFYLLFSLSAVVVGFVSNRVRTTRILAVIAVVWSLTALPVLLAAGVPALYASRIALGAAEGPTAPLAVHAVQKWFPEQARSVPTALINMGGALGLAIATPTLVYVIAQYGWRAAFAVLAATGLLWAVLWAFVGREGPLDTFNAGLHTAGKGETGTEPHIPYRRLFLNPTWLGALAVGAGAYWSLALGMAWLPAYLERALGHSAAAAGNIVIAPHLVSAAVLLGVPWGTGRWMRNGATGRTARGVTGGLLVLVAGVCMLALPHTGGGLAVLLLTLAFGLPNAMFPLHYLVQAQIVPVGRRGAVLATGTALVTLVGIAAPAVTGRIIDTADSASEGFRTAFTLSAALLIVGGLIGLLTVNPEREARRLGLTS